MVERPAFIGTFNGNPHAFIRDSNLTLVGDVASKSDRGKIETYSDIFFRIPPEERALVQGAWILTDLPYILIENAQRLIAEGKAERETREFFPKLIVVELEAFEHSEWQDKVTGIRAVRIKKGQLRFPTHPTPNS